MAVARNYGELNMATSLLHGTCAMRFDARPGLNHDMARRIARQLANAYPGIAVDFTTIDNAELPSSFRLRGQMTTLRDGEEIEVTLGSERWNTPVLVTSNRGYFGIG